MQAPKRVSHQTVAMFQGGESTRRADAGDARSIKVKQAALHPLTAPPRFGNISDHLHGFKFQKKEPANAGQKRQLEAAAEQISYTITRTADSTLEPSIKADHFNFDAIKSATSVLQRGLAAAALAMGLLAA